MVDCPNCGAEVTTPIKCWTVSSAKYATKGYVPEFRIGIFKCPECRSKFRSKVMSTAKKAETLPVKAVVAKFEVIRQGFKQTLRGLREKIELLETERQSLFVEIENLKKVAAARANALESEVNQLREELKSLRELLGDNEEKY